MPTSGKGRNKGEETTAVVVAGGTTRRSTGDVPVHRPDTQVVPTRQDNEV